LVWHPGLHRMLRRLRLPFPSSFRAPCRYNTTTTTFHADLWNNKLGLEARSPTVSLSKKVLDFASNESLRNSYINPFGGIRIGLVLEELDAMAGRVAYAHALGNSSLVSDVVVRPQGAEAIRRVETHLTIVTASCNRITLWHKLPAELSLDIEGRVTWVGRSSMEVCVHIVQHGKEGPVRVLESYFTMVARDKSNRAVALPPLLLQTAEEKILFEKGEANSKRRKEDSQRSLEIAPPTDEERARTHQLYLQTRKIVHDEGRLPPDLAWMGSVRTQSLVLMQPQSRNIHNKIFGGYLMRKAFELAWSSTFIFVGTGPAFSGMDDTSFLAPVEIGDSVLFTSQISFTQGKDVMVNVVADVISPRGYHGPAATAPFQVSKFRKTTNVFRFAFQCRNTEQIRQIVPETYEEVVTFIGGQRVYEDLRAHAIEKQRDLQ